MKLKDLKCPICGRALVPQPIDSSFDLYVAAESNLGGTEYEDEAHRYKCDSGHMIYFGDEANKEIEQ